MTFQAGNLSNQGSELEKRTDVWGLVLHVSSGLPGQTDLQPAMKLQRAEEY